VSLDRATLLAAYRPTLAQLVRRADRERAGVEIAMYVVALMRPTGYLLAVALQERYGRPDPDALLRRALEAEHPYAPVLLGVISRAMLAQLLDGISPRLTQIAAELRRLRVPRPRVPTLVAVSGIAEIVALDPDVPAPPSPCRI
jgi:hypothetical protein